MFKQNKNQWLDFSKIAVFEHSTEFLIELGALQKVTVYCGGWMDRSEKVQKCTEVVYELTATNYVKNQLEKRICIHFKTQI